MDILICTDGTDSSIDASEVITRFGLSTQTNVVVLGVSEHEEDIEKLARSMELIQKKIGGGFNINKKVRHGDPIDEIIAEVVEVKYDLVVLGGGGSQLGLLHPKVGATTGKLARVLDTHFLVVRKVPAKFNRILICAGPDSLNSDTMSVGGKWISNTGAQIGLLHVMPSGRMVETAGNGGKSPSDEKLMDQFVEQLKNSGVRNVIVKRLRQGLVVDEVLKELSEGGYDLLVIGAHYLPGKDLWHGTLLDDITDQLLNRSGCSVLII